MAVVFLAAAGYPDQPNFGPPPKIRQNNAATENTPTKFRKSVRRRIKNPANSAEQAYSGNV